MTQIELEQAKASIGIRLRKTRRARGLTQVQLGELTGSNQAVVQKIESGRVRHPRIIGVLALALDVNPAWLQWGEKFAPMQIDYCQIERHPK